MVISPLLRLLNTFFLFIVIQRCPGRPRLQVDYLGTNSILQPDLFGFKVSTSLTFRLEAGTKESEVFKAAHSDRDRRGLKRLRCSSPGVALIRQINTLLYISVKPAPETCDCQRGEKKDFALTAVVSKRLSVRLSASTEGQKSLL